MSKHTSKDSIVVRLAGDSGDGVQLMGSQFIASTALSGEDFATFPDFPAEIRAPVGTTFGVSAYQMNIGANGIQRVNIHLILFRHLRMQAGWG